MDWVEAMKQVKLGERVTREAWADREVHCCLHMGRLVIHQRDDGKYHPWIVGEPDIYARDWTTVADA